MRADDTPQPQKTRKSIVLLDDQSTGLPEEKILVDQVQFVPRPSPVPYDTKMAEPKTRPTDADVDAFIDAVPSEQRRADARVVHEMMSAATGQPAVLWGTSIIGYGSRPYVGSGGKTVDWPTVGFSPRKANLVLYLNSQLDTDLLAALGKHRVGVGCLYINKLHDVDLEVLRSLINVCASL
jgi:Domain of unknown function (DU1801)